MKKKQYVVIGLGRFGSSVAKTLYTLGKDVLAIDLDETIIQEISHDVTHAIQMDATDENALRSVGISNFDVAIVAIGSSMQSSIMVTILLKELGIKYIVVKAQNSLHAKVLNKIGADRVVLPERDMGTRVAYNLISTSILDHIELSPEYSIIEIMSPEKWHGKTLGELDIRSNYGINIMAIKRDNIVTMSPSADEQIEQNDTLIIIGGSNELSIIQSLK